MADEIAQVVDLEYKGIYYLLKGTKASIIFSKKYQLEVRKEFEKIDTMQILQKNNVERQERI